MMKHETCLLPQWNTHDMDGRAIQTFDGIPGIRSKEQKAARSHTIGETQCSRTRQ